MRTVALVLSLLAIGLLGLIACGGDDDETIAGSEGKGAGSEEKTAGAEKKGAKDEPASKKSCGELDRWRLTVEGDVSCSTAQRVVRREVDQGAPPPWTCSGPDAHIECRKNEPGIAIEARSEG